MPDVSISPPVNNRPVGTVVAGSLPSAATSTGLIYMVTDALVPAALGIVAGGGAVIVLVFSNGTNWIIL